MSDITLMSSLPKLFISLGFCALLILTFNINSIVPHALLGFSKAFGMSNSCNCVVFRMDDISDGYLDAEQLKIMDIFLSKGEPLTLGLIMHKFGNDSTILDKISEGYKKGLFELALHGWEHKNYSDMTEQEQKSSLYEANERMQKIFGNKSDIFIPPYNRFNNDTLNAIRELGIKIMSSSILDQNRFDLGKSIFTSKSKNDNASNAEGIYFLPYTIGFRDYVGRPDIKFPIQALAKNINANVEKYGYAVVLIHPQSFTVSSEQGTAIGEDGNKTQMSNKNIKDLEYLIDLLRQNGIGFSSFNKLIDR